MRPRCLALDYTWAVPHLPLDARTGTLEWHGDKGTPAMLSNHIRNQPEFSVSFQVSITASLGRSRA